MRQTAAQRSYVGSRAVLSRHGLDSVLPSVRRRPGFTLVEVLMAMAILMIIVMSVFMLITVSASSLKDSEMRDMAKNIATYTVEYLRSRNVTSDNNFIGTADWYSATTTSAKFPGLVDLGKNPVEGNTSAASLSINMNPALPDSNYSASTASYYSSLQGYVSLADQPADSDPSSEDGNAKVVGGAYFDTTTGAPLAVRFPLKSSGGISNFAALSGYKSKIYTSNTNCTTTTSAEYDPHYTNSSTLKAGSVAYRGFRVLSQVVARRASTSSPNHVQYYDVKVTVFWILGSAEHSYSLSTQIVSYGGS